MNLDLLISPNLLLYSLIGILVFILSIILFGRAYYKRKSENRLANKSQLVKYTSTIIGRNKYPEVDPFKASSTYLKMSLLFALLITLLAMNVTTYEREVEIPEDALTLVEEFEIEPPRTAEPPPPPPPPPPPVIQEVPNEEILEEDQVEFIDQSIEEQTEVAHIPAPTTVKKEMAPPPPPPPPPPLEEEFEEIFKVVEEMPQFPGCESISDKAERKQCADKKMLDFIYRNIRYPAIARENGIDGTVVIQFVVSKKGVIQKAKIIRDIGGQCGDEALRVVNLMNEKEGNWIPGRQGGKHVKVQFMLPVKFKLATT